MVIWPLPAQKAHSLGTKSFSQQPNHTGKVSACWLQLHPTMKLSATTTTTTTTTSSSSSTSTSTSTTTTKVCVGHHESPIVTSSSRVASTIGEMTWVPSWESMLSRTPAPCRNESRLILPNMLGCSDWARKIPTPQVDICLDPAGLFSLAYWRICGLDP